MRPLFLAFLLFYMVLISSGCSFSFYSGQYEFISTVTKSLTNIKNSKTPSSNWVLYWSNQEINLLPVEVGKSIWFVGEEDVVVKFDGWQIISVENLLPANVNMAISMRDVRQTFVMGTKVFQILECETWSYVKSTKFRGGKYSQVCRNESLEFDNMIALNDQGAIVELEFVFHPGYPPLKMAMEFELPLP